VESLQTTTWQILPTTPWPRASKPMFLEICEPLVRMQMPSLHACRQLLSALARVLLQLAPLAVSLPRAGARCPSYSSAPAPASPRSADFLLSRPPTPSPRVLSLIWPDCAPGWPASKNPPHEPSLHWPRRWSCATLLSSSGKSSSFYPPLLRGSRNHCAARRVAASLRSIVSHHSRLS